MGPQCHFKHLRSASAGEFAQKRQCPQVPRVFLSSGGPISVAMIFNAEVCFRASLYFFKTRRHLRPSEPEDCCRAAAMEFLAFQVVQCRKFSEKMVLAIETRMLTMRILHDLELLGCDPECQKFLVDKVKPLYNSASNLFDEIDDEEDIPQADARRPTTDWNWLAIQSHDQNPDKAKFESLSQRLLDMFLAAEGSSRFQIYSSFDSAADALRDLQDLLEWKEAGLWAGSLQHAIASVSPGETEGLRENSGH